MIYRVSYYKQAEMIEGRAPRYMEDIMGDTCESLRSYMDAEAELQRNLATFKSQLSDDQPYVEPEGILALREKVKLAQEQFALDHNGGAPGLVIRSAYKAPVAPIRETPSYVFESPEAQRKWYKKHKTSAPLLQRTCSVCLVGEITGRYKRLCDECEKVRENSKTRVCAECFNPISHPRYRRFCEPCRILRRSTKEKANRERTVTLRSVERIATQLVWAEKVLPSVTLEACKLASRYRGGRVPHVNNLTTRCRYCLEKFIEVQTKHLEELVDKLPETATI